ncbi:hypothetical protein L5515_009346 [Caenorhabditis briggsae]|uniref:Uncharacterized protein n=1 Tax=Caenorhabditis briggsae TaxID=6238 RepID=A0AAE9JMW4_CAEBR|nr:hypothetical protein L5515_009346 [Caenorhabditis briggsae]
MLLSLYTLCFAPENKVYTWFHILKRRCSGYHPNLGGFFNYLQKNYFKPSSRFPFERNKTNNIYINSKRHYSFIKTENGYIQFITALDSIINFYKNLNILFRTLAKLIRFYWIQTSDGYISKLITVSVNDSIYDRTIFSLTRGGFFLLWNISRNYKAVQDNV